MKPLQIFGFIASFASLLATHASASDLESLIPPKEFYTREEVVALKKAFSEKCDRDQEDMNSKIEYMNSLQTQVASHLQKLEAANNQIADFMNVKNDKEEGKLKKLARFYEAMDPEQASPHLQKVNDDLTIKIFDRMDTKKAGAILALYPAPRAAKITAAFPRLRIQADQGGLTNEQN
jgi:flagellar motility protein MotE (MotC chaperone)